MYKVSKSYWKPCPICENEFKSVTALVCPECKRRIDRSSKSQIGVCRGCKRIFEAKRQKTGMFSEYCTPECYRAHRPHLWL